LKESTIVSDKAQTVTAADMETPLVSVITVCLNAGAHISQALGSVLAQTYANVEHIVVDGGSTDGTLEVLAEFKLRLGDRLRWISESDEGRYDAMNKGIALATGSLIGTLNADDFYEPDAIASAVAAWESHPEAGVLYGDLRTHGVDGDIHTLNSPATVRLGPLLRNMTLHHPTTFVSARVYEEVGGYDTLYPITADYDFILRCVEAGVKFQSVDRVLTNFSLFGASDAAMRRTDRDATRVRIAHGVNPILAWVRFFRRAVAYAIYSAFAGIPAFRKAYDTYKGRHDTRR